MNKNTLIAIHLAVLLATSFIYASALPDPNSNEQSVSSIIEEINSGNRNAVDQLRELGTNVVTELLPYVHHASKEVRYQVASHLVQYGGHTSIPVFAELLNDPAGIVRSKAIDGLFQYDNDTLSSFENYQLTHFLSMYLTRWDEKSYKGAILLGRLGATSGIDVLVDAYEKASILRTNSVIAKDSILADRICSASLGALLTLNHPPAIKSLRELIASNHVRDRLLACEAVTFSEQSKYLAELRPLLSDKQDAINVAPTHFDPYFIRVCDVAAETSINLLNLSGKFGPTARRLNDDNLHEISEILTKSSRN
ncbi:MAG: hypothetical protein M9963_02710 [Kiritimatiellae bacterium]|nr:hypothetical protein [Kiritimatiellia bacterium]MCO5068180.1 hypothetical protein [Kiritimatiellia bacterium]